MKQNKILFIIGTRPEAIKMAPIILELKKHTNYITEVCSTGQHREMVDQVVEFFDIPIDYDLDLMEENQTLFDITAKSLRGIGTIIDKSTPDLIFVQGDTTTAFTGALAAYYKKVKVAHIEAGLRSNNKYSPYPEEINRVLIGHIGDYHFAPTEKAKQNLEQEKIKNHIWVVGNTVIDALFLTLDTVKSKRLDQTMYEDFDLPFLNNKDIKTILITSHRRESFGEPFINICNAVKELANQFTDIEFVYPVHPNPNVRKPANKILGGIKNIHLLEPLDYLHLVWLMNKSYMVLTDSGGIQEEAPSLGKPLLVLREVTEREEGIEAGTAKLVGTDPEMIIMEAVKLLTDENEYKKMSKAVNPYGDGKSSRKIADVISAQLSEI